MMLLSIVSTRHISLYLLVYGLLSICQVNTLRQCTEEIGLRKEIRKLTNDEMNVMVSAFTRMQQGKWFDWFAYVHNVYGLYTHSSSEFLPWHRHFAREFELTARSYEPSFTLPYWDSTIDSNSPSSSVIFTPNYFGGNGAGSDSCVTDGFLSNWTMEFPDKHCLRRKFNQGATIGSWQSPESVTSDLQMSTGNYTDFRLKVELGIHASVHNGVQGDMSTMYSPNDPIFYLHHSNIDRLWWKWQNMAASNMELYQGLNSAKQEASSSNILPGYNITIADTFRLGYGTLCYAYDDVQPLVTRDFNFHQLQIKKAKRKSKYLYRTLKLKKPYHNRNSTKSRKTRFNIRAIERSNLDTNSDNIKKVTNVPQMNLVTALDPTVISKFFPLIATNDLTDNAVAMPNIATVRATQFASNFVEKNVLPDTNLESIEDPTNNTHPVQSGTILGSLLATADKVAGSFNAFKDENPEVLRELTPFSKKKLPFGSETPEGLKLRIPSRLDDKYIEMMGYNKDDYEKYYSEKVELVNLLNQNGYISPYT